MVDPTLSADPYAEASLLELDATISAEDRAAARQAAAAAAKLHLVLEDFRTWQL
ncbi:hypothetical protein [Arthrobacter glacialis]|uniref:hypothetical protein n=1 Tax=Arthrobacter glacialis TaxID=1664 RepID=UPI0013FE1E61|nr:hypothetical protein [Arthrobacter glacialis]